jgi:hypothetical protein
VRCGDHESRFSREKGRREPCVPRRHTRFTDAASATSCNSSLNRSSLNCVSSPARLWHHPSGSRPRSTRTGTRHARRSQSSREAVADMLAWQHSGFSVDASVRISLADRDVPGYLRRLEHLLRYCARLAVALQRLSVVSNSGDSLERDRYTLPRHQRGNWVGPGRTRKSTRPGSSGVIKLTPFEFLDRLATLDSPPPRPRRPWLLGRGRPSTLSRSDCVNSRSRHCTHAIPNSRPNHCGRLRLNMPCR